MPCYEGQITGSRKKISLYKSTSVFTRQTNFPDAQVIGIWVGRGLCNKVLLYSRGLNVSGVKSDCLRKLKVTPALWDINLDTF